jgi:hypothetical protein
MRSAMTKLKVTVAVLLALVALKPATAQYTGQYSGQYSGQAGGQSNGRVDGRGSHTEGLPPSSSDKGNLTFDNPVDVRDCAEVNALTPDARPGWQSRVRSACGDY